MLVLEIVEYLIGFFVVIFCRLIYVVELNTISRTELCKDCSFWKKLLISCGHEWNIGHYIWDVYYYCVDTVLPVLCPLSFISLDVCLTDAHFRYWRDLRSELGTYFRESLCSPDWSSIIFGRSERDDMPTRVVGVEEWNEEWWTSSGHSSRSPSVASSYDNERVPSLSYLDELFPLLQAASNCHAASAELSMAISQLLDIAVMRYFPTSCRTEKTVVAAGQGGLDVCVIQRGKCAGTDVVVSFRGGVTGLANALRGVAEVLEQAIRHVLGAASMPLAPLPVSDASCSSKPLRFHIGPVQMLLRSLGNLSACEDLRQAIVAAVLASAPHPTVRAQYPSSSSCGAENEIINPTQSDYVVTAGAKDKCPEDVASASDRGDADSAWRCRVIFTGCGDAGAAAAMCMLLLRDVLVLDLAEKLPVGTEADITCITFGSPAFLDSRDEAAVSSECVSSLVHLHADRAAATGLPCRRDHSFQQANQKSSSGLEADSFRGGGMASFCSLGPLCGGHTEMCQNVHYILPGGVVIAGIEDDRYKL